jgi:hypothetical protein
MNEDEKKDLKIQATELSDLIKYNTVLPPDLYIVLKRFPDAVLELLKELEEKDGK